MPKIHRSTWCVGILTATLLAVLNCGGEVVPEHKALEHGWPWAYASRDVTGEMYPGGNFFGPFASAFPRDTAVCWRLDKADTWHGGMLVADAFVLIALTVAIAALWEVRRRRRSLWQFTLLEGLVAAAVVGAICVYWRGLYQDRLVDREIAAAYRARPSEERIDTTHEAPFGWLDPHFDVPFDWLWETLQVSHRPYHRRTVFFMPQDLDQQPSLEPLHLLSKYSQLREIEFYHFHENADEVVDHLPALPYLRRLSFGEMRIGAKGIEGLARFPRLIALDVTSDGTGLRALRVKKSLEELVVRDHFSSSSPGILPAGLSEICELTQLHRLKLITRAEIPSGGWKELGQLRGLEELTMWRTGKLKSADVAAIASLPRLRSLSINGAALDDDVLQELAKSAHRLESLSIRENRHLTDAGIEQLAQLPRLKELTVSKDQFTRETLMRLKAALPSLVIDDSR